MNQSEDGAADAAEGVAIPLHRPDYSGVRGFDESLGRLDDESDCWHTDEKSAAKVGKEGGTGGRNKSIMGNLCPISMEYSVFRTTVWAHLNPKRKGRLSLKDFEETLSVLPPATSDNIVQEYTLRLRNVAVRNGGTCRTEAEQARRLFRAVDSNRTGEISLTELWISSLQLQVIRSNFVGARSGRRFLFADTSLGFMPMSWRVRQMAAEIMTDHRFEAFTLFCIVVNSVVMAVEDYEDPGKLVGNPNFRNKLVFFSVALFLGVFAIEMPIKIVAMGLVANERCYLREPWNRLDAVVVVSGVLGYIPGVAGASVGVLRIIRILRPLRTLRATPTLRDIVEALIGSIPGIVNALILQVMFFVLFAVLGLQLWAGVTHNECRATVLPTENGTWETYMDDPRVCSAGSGGLLHCDTDVATAEEYPFCAAPSAASTGTTWEDPPWQPEELNWGITNFDNIATSLLTIFQCITMEGWVRIMYMYVDGFSSWFSPVFFILVVGFGGFFMTNLFFAVMWEQFSAINDIPGQVDPDNPEILQRFGQFRKSARFRRNMKKVTPSEHANSSMATRPPRCFDRGTPRRMARDLIESTLFQVSIVLCIVFNTGLLCLDAYPEDPDVTHVVELANFWLTVAFAGEMAIKVWAVGPRYYAADRFNLFDGIIVLCSLLELLLAAFGSVEGLGGIVSALRFFRLLRVLKLAKSWRSMRRIITTAADSLHEMGHIVGLLALCIYIFSLLGMKLFSTKFWFAGGGVSVPWEEVVNLNATERLLAGVSRPRVRFDSFVSSLLACFIIITGEDWNNVMYDGIRGGGSYWYSMFFVACVALGQFVVLNLFLAILLSNIDTIDKRDNKSGKAPHRGFIHGSWTRVRAMRGALTPWHRKEGVKNTPIISNGNDTTGSQESNEDEKEESAGEVRGAQAARASSLTDACFQPGNMEGIEDGSAGEALINQGAGDRPEPSEWPGYAPPRRPSINPFASPSVSVVARAGGTNNERETVSGVECGAGKGRIDQTTGGRCRAFYARVRQRCRNLIMSHKFEVGTMTLIFASSVTLVISTPLDDPSTVKTRVLYIVDLVMTALFAGEMVLKIFGLGTRYFTDGWNLMDGSIVITTVTSDILQAFVAQGTAFSSLRVLRALRALRPLRLIPRAPGLRRVVNAMIRGLPPVLNVAVVVLVFFLIFSILGVRLFKGTFIGCDFSEMDTAALVSVMSEFGLSRSTYVKPLHEADCVVAGGTWGPTVDQNFDNVASGLLALFEISTTEGWVNVMLAGVDSVGIGVNPVQDWSTWMVLFFVGVILVGNFFATNLFVGAVIEAYQTLSSEDASFLMSDAQKSWVELQKMACLAGLKPQPKRPPGLRGRAFDLVERHSFEKAVMGMIITYAFILMLHHWGEPPAVTRLIEISSTTFTFLFAAEILLKAMAYGPIKLLKRSPWNVYDALVVGVAVVAMVLDWVYGISFQAVISTARVTRVLLVFKIMRRAQSLQELMDMLIANLLGMLNISALLVLLIICYAVVGVHLYATVTLQTEVGVHSNFQTFVQAIITLFRYTTGEAWNTAMHELFLSPEDGDGVNMPVGTSCVEHPTYAQMSEAWDIKGTTTYMIGCGPHPAVTIAFFSTYVMLSSFILMNIIVAIIVDSVSAHFKARELKLPNFQLCIFCDEWSKFDQDATYLLPVQHLPSLWQAVQIPLGLRAWTMPTNASLTRKWVGSLGIHDYGGKVYFHEVVNALALKVVEHHVEDTITAKHRRDARAGRAPHLSFSPQTIQAQASAIVEADLVKSPDMKQHSMFLNRSVCTKEAAVISARSVHTLEQVMAAAHVQSVWRAHWRATREHRANQHHSKENVERVSTSPLPGGCNGSGPPPPPV